MYSLFLKRRMLHVKFLNSLVIKIDANCQFKRDAVFPLVCLVFVFVPFKLYSDFPLIISVLRYIYTVK